jgi:ribosome-binding factor A
MQGIRQDKMAEQIRQHAATFIEGEASKQSLITVTRTDISPDFRNVTVFITVMPDSEAHTALKFLTRKQRDIREYLKKRLKMRIIPIVKVELDYGEKNRQRIDQLLMEDKMNSKESSEEE